MPVVATLTLVIEGDMIDLSLEQPIPLAEACRLVPPGRGGAKTHLSTLLRWILRGVRAPGGGLVRLEALRLGGRWVTSREALQRFAEALTPCSDGQAPLETRRGRARRQRAAEQAERDLEAMGV
jgi:hypothetical protein